MLTTQAASVPRRVKYRLSSSPRGMLSANERYLSLETNAATPEVEFVVEVCAVIAEMKREAVGTSVSFVPG